MGQKLSQVDESRLQLMGKVKAIASRAKAENRVHFTACEEAELDELMRGYQIAMMVEKIFRNESKEEGRV
jgi:hypothetical protein